MDNNIETEAKRELCHIIAYEADKSPLRWSDGQGSNFIYISNINDADKVCRVRVYPTSLNKSPVRAAYYVYFIGKYYFAAMDIQEPRITGITDAGGYKFILPKHVIDFVKDVVNRTENTKENNMNEFTLETCLFHRLKENEIYYKFNNGVYNPEEIIIVTKTNYNICRVRSIPNSESSRWAYEVNWFMPLHIIADLKLDRVKQYETSNQLIKDILRVIEKAPAVSESKGYSYDNRDRIKDVIFNDPATIIIWADGSKTVVKAENEKFDPEKGLAMAICRKAFGNKHDYYDVFKKYVGRFEKKQKKITR